MFKTHENISIPDQKKLSNTGHHYNSKSFADMDDKKKPKDKTSYHEDKKLIGEQLDKLSKKLFGKEATSKSGKKDLSSTQKIRKKNVSPK